MEDFPSKPETTPTIPETTTTTTEVSIPAETLADATVMPGDQTTSPPTPPVHEKGDWEKFSGREGPYPWHLV